MKRGGAARPRPEKARRAAHCRGSDSLPLGVMAAFQAAWLTAGETVRTLPSSMPTRHPLAVKAVAR